MSKGINEVPMTAIAAKGGLHVADTSAHTGNWSVFYPIGECVIASITRPGFGASPITALTTSVPIYGDITALTLTSGAGDLIK